MKIKNMEFLISAVKPEQYPENNLPEIAFAGRSNVGKSSLINMLLNRNNFARTSSTPGKTQTINFYEINNEFRFVDLPGYGYAKVSKEQHRSWGNIIKTYLSSRDNLIEIILLLDIRHKPTEKDREMYSWIISNGFSGIIIVTKSDKITKGKMKKHLEVIRKELKAENNIIIPISSSKRVNKYIVWELFNEIFNSHGYDIYIEKQSGE